MCKGVGGEGTASLVVIPALVSEDIARKREGGGLENSPSPVGRGVRQPIAEWSCPTRDLGQTHSHAPFST